jgi:hypothetical protein
MPALAQGLGYGGTARTPLAGAVGVYLDQFSPSFFHFVREKGQEISPPSIINRLSQHPASQSFDVQILNGNQVMSVDYLTGHLVMEVRPLILNMLVHSLEYSNCLPPPVATFLAPGYLSLSTSEGSLSFTVVAGVVDNRAVTQNRKAFQPNINPSDFPSGGHWLRGYC